MKEETLQKKKNRREREKNNNAGSKLPCIFRKLLSFRVFFFTWPASTQLLYFIYPFYPLAFPLILLAFFVLTLCRKVRSGCVCGRKLTEGGARETEGETA